MWSACSGATFAKKTTKVLEITSHTKTTASPANRIAFSSRDRYSSRYNVDIFVWRPMHQCFIAWRRGAGTATPGSTDVVKKAFALSLPESSTSDEFLTISAPRLDPGPHRRSRAVLVSSGHSRLG